MRITIGKGLFMKDAFFRWWDSLTEWIYRLVLKATYLVLQDLASGRKR